MKSFSSETWLWNWLAGEWALAVGLGLGQTGGSLIGAGVGWAGGGWLGLAGLGWAGWAGGWAGSWAGLKIGRHARKHKLFLPVSLTIT